MGNNLTCLHTFKIIYILKGETYPCTSCDAPFKITCRLRQTSVRSNTINNTNDNIGVTLLTIFHKFCLVSRDFLHPSCPIVESNLASHIGLGGLFHGFIITSCQFVIAWVLCLPLRWVHIFLRPWMKGLHSILTISAILMHTI
jgi:hypothetical protein